MSIDEDDTPRNRRASRPLWMSPYAGDQTNLQDAKDQKTESGQAYAHLYLLHLYLELGTRMREKKKRDVGTLVAMDQ